MGANPLFGGKQKLEGDYGDEDGEREEEEQPDNRRFLKDTKGRRQKHRQTKF